MKYILFTLIFIPSQLFAQDFKITTLQDSTIIRDTNLAIDPFLFGENPLAHLKKFKSKISIETVKNLHVENKIDTVFRFTIRNNNFAVYKVDEKKNFLVTATVRSTKFKTNQGFKIGMKKSQVATILSRYNLKNIPRCLVLENADVYQVVILRFNKRKLTKIEFEGYLD